jgi:hypothetical protein
VSGLDPVFRGAQGAADPVALEVQALKADAEKLRGLLSPGDIVAAKVLPFNGLTDLLAILGNRVAASLPPTVRPGDTMILEVTGFDGDRIMVRNLGVDTGAQQQAQNAAADAPDADAEDLLAALRAAYVPTPSGVPPRAPATADQRAVAPPTSQEQDTEAEPVALPRAIFVDAAVQQSIRQTEAQQAPPTPAGYPRVTIAVPPRAIETDQSIEAKLIAARAATQPAGSAAPPAAGAPTGTRPAAVPPRGAPQSGGPAVAPPRTPVWIAASARASAAAEDAVPARTAATPAPASSPASSPNPPLSSPRTAQTYSEPTLLLRSLRIPVTPSNVAAARMALTQPQRLPVALAALERALPLGNADPRVNTLRAIIGFLTNLDPDSEAFPAQLSAYISHVLDGPEPKLATVLQTYVEAEAEELPAGQTAPQGGAAATNQTAPPPAAPGQPAAAATGPAANAASAGGASATAASSDAQDDESLGSQVDVTVGNNTIALARIAERLTAMDHDLKVQLQSFISDPPPNAGAASLAAAQTALAVLTAAQLANMAAQQDPRALTITLPLPFMGNGEPAHIKISREKPESDEQLDADNFHIAFILQTKNVGTVAVDLQTVGRGVNVAVKSETPRYAAAFKAMLDDLGGRLENLRYNVVGLESEVVSRAGETITTAAPAPPPPQDDDASGLDLRA